MSPGEPEAESPAIALRGLRKVFPGRRSNPAVTAVDGIDLTVHRGEVFGLLGPNGAGKTTTVEICEGLQMPTEGTVEILGRRFGAGQDQEIRERIGVSLQETAFLEKQSVREILELFASFYPGSRTIEEAIGLVALESKAKSRYVSLSGGQKQRVAVAVALLGRPELLFLDEPTTGLDPQSRRSLWEVVRNFQRDGGTVLLTTHYMDEAEQLCDRVAVIDHGQLVTMDTPAALIASVGGSQFVEATVAGGRGLLDEAALLAMPGVQTATLNEDQVLLACDGAHRAVPALFALAERQGVELHNLRTRQATLEDVFVHFTGHSLRDDGVAEDLAEVSS